MEGRIVFYEIWVYSCRKNEKSQILKKSVRTMKSRTCVTIQPEISILIDPNVYPIPVVLRVAYLYTDNFYVWITQPLAGTVINICSKQESSEFQESLIGDIFNHLLDYALRFQIDQETRAMKEAVWQRAFRSMQ